MLISSYRKIAPLLTFIRLTLTITFFSPPSFATTNNPTFNPPVKYKLSGGHVIHSNPTLADITGDNIPEVIITTTQCRGVSCSTHHNATLEVLDGNGQVIWSTILPGPSNASPSIADIDADGYPDIVVAIGDVQDTDHNGQVIAFDHTGAIKWQFFTQDHIDVTGNSGGDGYTDGVFSTPALCDVNNDNTLEIAFGAWDHRIYLLDHQGQLVWQNMPGVATGPGYTNGDTVWSSPACADLNYDGFQEIIIGADISQGGILPDGLPPLDGGFLYVFSHDGTALVRRYLPEAIYSSPAIADLDNDGSLEIVVGTSFSWWLNHNGTLQPYVYAFDTSQVFSNLSRDDANKLPHLPGWPQATPYPGFSSPAIADVDNDGDLEVFIGTSHPNLDNGPNQPAGAGQIHAWHHTGQPVAGWPVTPRNQTNLNAPIYSSPTIADIDADGQLEILFTMLWDIHIYHSNGTLQERLNTSYTTVSSPTVGDTNGDNEIEVWIAGSNYYNPDFGFLWKFENGAQDLGNHPWPMFHANPAHTGHIPSMVPRLNISNAIPRHLFYQHNSHQTQTFQITIQNHGQLPLTWVADNLPTGLSPSANTGQLNAGQDQKITISVNGGNRPLGRHNLTFTITATDTEGQIVAGAPTIIPITLDVINQTNHTHLPTTVTP